MSTKALLYLTFVLGIALVGSGCAAPLVYKGVKKLEKKDSEKSEESTSQQQEGQKP